MNVSGGVIWHTYFLLRKKAERISKYKENVK